MKDSIRKLMHTLETNWSFIYETLKVFFEKYLVPFIWFLTPLFVWVVGKYKVWFNLLSYKDGVYSTKRGARAISVLTVTTVLSLYINIWHILPVVSRVTYDFVVFEIFSYDTEKMYFSKPEWIESDVGSGDTVLSTFGCDAKPCTDDNSREYKFRDSLYLDIKYWLTRAEPYDHSDIAGIMQGELNYCEVSAYGSRFKPLGYYPFIYNVRCYDIPKE